MIATRKLIQDLCKIDVVVELTHVEFVAALAMDVRTDEEDTLLLSDYDPQGSAFQIHAPGRFVR